MDKRIGKGDLVMVVRGAPCCGNPFGLGLPFRVLKMVSDGYCIHCFTSESDVAYSEAAGGYSVRQLIRIDPDILSADVPTKEELTV